MRKLKDYNRSEMKDGGPAFIEVIESLAMSIYPKMDRKQMAAVARLEKAIVYEMAPLSSHAYALCLEIEKLPASEQATNLSVMASTLRQKIDKAFRCECCNNAPRKNAMLKAREQNEKGQ